MTTPIPSIPRHLLPQIPKEKLPEFVRYLYDHGIKISKKLVPIEHLLPIQKNVNKEKVRSMIKDKKSLTIPIIITSDGYIVDGHHRWVAAHVEGKKNLDAIICDCPLSKFLKLSHDFDGSFVKSVNELTIYGRIALTEEKLHRVSKKQALRLYKILKLEKHNVDFEQFFRGVNVELEHQDVTKGNLIKTALIALAHIKEVPNYYSKLDKYVEEDDAEELTYSDNRGYKMKYDDGGYSSGGSYVPNTI